MKKLLMLFKKQDTFTKQDVISFANYWHCKQSLFGYEGEQEKLFNNWKNKRISK